MDNITTALTITVFGATLSFAIGYYGLARRKGKLTPRGRVSLIGMLVGAALTIGPEVFKWRDAQDNDIRGRETLREIQKRNYSLENSYLTVVLGVPWNDHHIETYNKAIASFADYVRKRVKDEPGTYSPPDWGALQTGIENELLAHLRDFRLSLTVNDVPVGKRDKNPPSQTVMLTKLPIPGHPIMDPFSHDEGINMITHMSLDKMDMALFRNKSLPDLTNTDLIISTTEPGRRNDIESEKPVLPVAKRAYLRLEAGIVIEFRPTPGDLSGRLVAHIPANIAELE